jgi:hypothetical protein
MWTENEKDMRMHYYILMCEWIKDSSETHWTWGKTIADILKTKFNWKTWDIKNGWQSIKIHWHKIQDINDIYEDITDEYEWMTITVKNTVVVLREKRHLTNN